MSATLTPEELRLLVQRVFRHTPADSGLAIIVDVLPDPAAATVSTRLSKQIHDLICSRFNGDFSTVLKNSA